jgi:tetrapyrrole methylase family protein/MazG family protein
MSTSDAGQRFSELLSVMARLRSDDGCPWDRAQTPESLRPCLLEETHEVLEAIERRDAGQLRDELGDLLLQVVFHAQMAEEAGTFAVGDVLETLTAKLRRRHPHVFGEVRVDSPAAALRQWEAIKRAEPSSGSVVDGVPRSLPSLSRAQRIQRGASRVGFDWSTPVDALVKVREETDEVTAALGGGRPDEIASEVGDLLFAVVNVARLAGVDAETALGDAVQRFGDRFRYMEETLVGTGRDLSSLPLEEQERLWERSKARERQPQK